MSLFTEREVKFEKNSFTYSLGYMNEYIYEDGEMIEKVLGIEYKAL